jgi:SAM-dependent methyltransferase
MDGNLAQAIEAGARPSRHDALVALVHALKAHAFQFVTPTPATHRRVIKRPQMGVARSLRDIFGWNLPFDPDILPADIYEAAVGADILDPTTLGLRSRLRAASLGDDLFLHSALPAAEDSVFFGPDTYRFANFLRRELARQAVVGVAADIGTGSGAGAVTLARLVQPSRLIATDVNPLAITLARANLAAAGVEAQVEKADAVEGLKDGLDLIIANPPFIADPTGRTYRDGGHMHGARLSLDWALGGAQRLAPGGRLLLYTGSAIVEGKDALRSALAAGLDPGAYELSYDELDPDIFGGQLAQPAYADVERIAAIGAVITRRAVKGGFRSDP